VVLVALAIGTTARAQDARALSGMRRVGGGVYVPFYRVQDEGDIRVEPFLLDLRPVTNGEFLDFVRSQPRWQRSRASELFTDASYLSSWSSDLGLGEDVSVQQPVTFVSYFAASAYCASLGKRLPSEAEWEWAAYPSSADSHSEDAIAARLLAFYSRPRGRLPEVGETLANQWGIQDLHGVIWEWVEDFNASFAAADNRQDGDRELGRVCGGAAIGADDVKNYAAFMRFAFRTSLEARYAIHHLGFRCARSLE
jgi:formylglycine-generating enzyme required for sulfatase activity